jgi:hypothetical protein
MEVLSAGMTFGLSGAAVTTIGSIATGLAYTVAGGIAVNALSQAGEIVTGHNVIRDDFMGGSQGAYDALNVGLVVASAGINYLGATNPALGGSQGSGSDDSRTKDGSRTAAQAGISDSDATRIQNAADRTGQDIYVVGSRADGTATETSDWDYILSGDSAQRHSASSSLPSGFAGGSFNSSGFETGIDIFTNYYNSPNYTPLDPSKPYVQFSPSN